MSKYTLEEITGNETDLDKVVKLSKRPREFYELHPEYIQSDLKRFSVKPVTKPSRIKGSSKSFDDTRRIIPQINDQLTNKQNLQKAIKVAYIKEEQERLEKIQETKKHINNLANALEVVSGGYILSKGLGHLTKAGLRNLGTHYNQYGLPIRNANNRYIRLADNIDALLKQADKGQVVMNSIGVGADIAQEATENANWVNKAELVGGTAGIIGGLNIVRNNPWFGRHRKAIDTTLDVMGYGAAGYDIGNYLLSD